MTTLNDIDEGVANKILGLLAMANHAGSNENEAANAMRLAQRLADAHNLSLANLDPDARKAASSKREDIKTGGGLYQWQRDLFKAIAELNHCKHWVSEETVEGKVSAYEKRKYGAEEAKYRAEHGHASWGKEWRHRLLGSPVNVISTRHMAEYLQGAVERLARDYVGNDPKRYYIPDAIAYREGVSARVVEMLKAKREEDLAEQRRQKEEAQARGDGSSLMILDDVADAEAEANHDYQFGIGSWRKIQDDKRAREAAWAERQAANAEAERVQAEWDAANPVEAAARNKAAAEAQTKYWDDFLKSQPKTRHRPSRATSMPRERAMTDREKRQNSGAFYEGKSAGSKISLDKQVDTTTRAKLK